jgi:hypothetical protein
MTCKLCKLPRTLQESHIIPKFIYKPLRDDKNRMQRFSIIDSNEKKYKKRKPIQDGLKEHLLCIDCEQLLNDKYEKYFKTAWFDEKKCPETIPSEGIKITGLNYSKFKLFHLSVLFRASVSSLPEFNEVNLGPHENTLREILLNDAHVPDTKYTVVCHAITKIDNQIHLGLITSPFRLRQPNGYNSYGFCFAGCVWYYVVDNRATSYFSDFMLRSNGELDILGIPWDDFLNL